MKNGILLVGIAIALLSIASGARTCNNDNDCMEYGGGQCVNGMCRDPTETECSVICDDGNACNGVETCVAGSCQPGTPVGCQWRRKTVQLWRDIIDHLVQKRSPAYYRRYPLKVPPHEARREWRVDYSFIDSSPPLRDKIRKL